MSNNATCPTNALPEDENLGIDSDSIYAVVPRGNTTSNDIPDDWMVSCCEPSPVQLASDGLIGTCWQWCDLPPKYTNWTSETSKMSDQFRSCITSSTSYMNSSVQPNIFHVSAAGRHGAVGDGMIGLAVVLGLTVWRILIDSGDLDESKNLSSLNANDEIHALVFSSNCYWLCAATSSSMIIFDLEKKKTKVDELKPDFTATGTSKKSRDPKCVSLAWSADGQTLLKTRRPVGTKGSRFEII